MKPTINDSKLEEAVRQAYEAGRQSILKGYCSGTSLDDAHLEEVVRDIIQQAEAEEEDRS